MAKRFDELGAILFSEQVFEIDSCSVNAAANGGDEL